jgi:hypothetical protein
VREKKKDNIKEKETNWRKRCGKPSPGSAVVLNHY